jgi:putative membrane protein
MNFSFWLYKTLLWLHILAVISWMAGILYLYRLFINHRERGVQSRDNHELLTGMEYRLWRYITLPAMVVSVVVGLAMAGLNTSLAMTGWFAAKFAFVLLLIGATLYANKLRHIAAENPTLLPTGRTLRFLNEVPTLLMMLIVGMVIFRPFS